MEAKSQEIGSLAYNGPGMTPGSYSPCESMGSGQGLLSQEVDEKANGGHRTGRRWSLSSVTGRIHVRYGQQWHASFPYRQMIAKGMILVVVLLLIIALSGTALGPSGRARLMRHPYAPRYLLRYGLEPHGLDRISVNVEHLSGDFCTTWSNSTINELPSHNSALKRPVPHRIAKPHGFKIIGLIFYGRPNGMDILDCYLQQNLVSNGGLLDEIRFVANTEKKEALDWLDEFVERAHEYKRANVPAKSHYGDMWRLHGSDSDTMFIKLDDDLTWLSQDAIPNLVQSRLQYKEPLAILGNLINSPMTSWVHHRLNAIHAFLPEKERKRNPGAITATWRTSELPDHSGPLPNDAPTNHDLDQWKPPYEGHRWLPLRNNKADVWRTPITRADPDLFSIGWHSWTLAAQQHMSLFQNLENNELWRYSLTRGDSTNGDHMIHTQYVRYNVNVVAIWGKDVAANLPVHKDDEEFFTVTLARKLGRPILLDTRVLAAHFSFTIQHHDMAQTDIMDRYRAYANEAVCPENRQRAPVDRLCKGF